MILCEDTKRCSGWTYDHYINHLAVLRKVTHPRGGHLVIMKGAGGHYNARYEDIITHASRHHGMYIHEGLYPAFATRYAEYLWANDARDLPEAEDRIDWGGSEAHLLQWPRFAYVRETGGGKRTELILHMINKPQMTRFNSEEAPPPVRTNVRCSIRAPAGLEVRDVWCASGDDGIWQKRLAFERRAETLTFEVPQLWFWNLVVVRFEGVAQW